jgi:hypothetical protein
MFRFVTLFAWLEARVSGLQDLRSGNFRHSFQNDRNPAILLRR